MSARNTVVSSAHQAASKVGQGIDQKATVAFVINLMGCGQMQEAVQRMTIQSMGQLPMPLNASALTHLQIVQAAADNAERSVQEAEQ